MTRYAQHIAAPVPQSEPVDPRQVQNNAGGFTFTLDCWKRLDRFLILGAEGGTYYVGERKLTIDNAKAVKECLDAGGLRTVLRIVEISAAGKAPKNDPAIFALALAASHTDPKTRAAALVALPQVCRIGTHLFQFCESVNALRGWGRALRKAIAKWYLDKDAAAAAFQVIKYQQRNGWSHRDVLRLCHAEAKGSPSHEALFRWLTNDRSLAERTVKRRQGDQSINLSSYNAVDPGRAPELLAGYEILLQAKKVSVVVALIEQYGFTHEMIPTEHKNSPEVWSALLQKMPLGAMVRNLGKMSSIGVLAQLSEGEHRVIGALFNRYEIKKARLHPIALLSALRVYAQGHGEKGSLSWSPNPRIIDALNEAFYLAFEMIEPTNRPTLLALDVSGSMACQVNGTPGLSARDVTAAMAMATARVEPNYAIHGFSTRFMPLNISPKQRLDDVVRSISNLPFEGTDCSLPMRYATASKLGIDAFVVYTDNETWAGPVHPHIALQEYRNKSGRNSKLVVCGTAATEFTIADPTDPGMLDVVGFSADCPAIIADFTREG